MKLILALFLWFFCVSLFYKNINCPHQFFAKKHTALTKCPNEMERYEHRPAIIIIKLKNSEMARPVVMQMASKI